MPAEYSTVACAEVKDTAVEDTNLETGTTCSVTLEVSGANVDALRADLINNARPWPRLAAWPSPPKCYATTVKGFSTNSPVDGQMYVYDIYYVEAKYSTEPSRTIVSESIEPAVEFTKLDFRWFRWSSGECLTENEAPGFLTPGLNLVRSYSQKAAIPADFITAPGSVHNALYSSPNLVLDFPAETLLYLPNPVSQTVTTTGSSGYSYTIKFAYRPQGWNKFYRPSTNSYEEIYDLSGSVVKPYPPADLSALLT